jgi:hypothetical protein
MATSAQIRQQLVEALQLDLIGPTTEHRGRLEERLPQPPSIWYTTGFLVPNAFQEEAGRPAEDDLPSSADLAGEETSNDAAIRQERGEDEDDANDSPRDTTSKRNWFPSSAGLSLIVERGSTIEVTTTWGDYSPPAKDGDDPSWDRTHHQVPRTLHIDRLGDSGDIPLEGPPERPKAEGLCLRWIARPAPASLGYPTNQLSLSLFLLNKRAQSGGKQIRFRDPVTAFQTQLRLHCPQGFPPRLDALQEASKDGDERLAALQYRRDLCFATGHNVAVLADPAAMRSDPDPRCTTLTTTWLPVAAVPRVLPEPKSPPAQLHLGMAVLADLAKSSGVSERLLPIVAAYRDWIAEQPRHPVQVPEQEATANHLARLAEECATRIESGIHALADPLVREAFRTMNLVMDQAQRQRMAFSAAIPPERFGDQPKTIAPSWRLFQLAFILMSLPGLAAPSTPEGLAQREIVELLFFPTGGGKTEAYLGLSAFTLVLRRLRHPGIAGAGLTVLMRYTLRLLTLDQLGRAATLICALELERQRRQAANDPHPLGDWPFEIGMWVGKGASPNKLGGPNDPDPRCAHAVLNRWQKQRSSDRPIPIETCPWCNRPIRVEGFSLQPDKAPDRLVIHCRPAPDQSTKSTKKPSDGQSVISENDFAHMGPCPFQQQTPLPVLAVDEQIYRRLPCFLIATVDKFASLPWVGKTSALFGQVSTYQLARGASGIQPDPAGFWGAAETDQGAHPLPAGRLPPPELVIQDELHLISGPLGTLAGLYETAIERLMRPNPASPPPKIIASTATVRRASSQIQALFARREARVFPPPGPERNDNFFSHTVDDPDQARLYVGLSAPGRNLKGVLLRSYLGLMAAAQKAWDDNTGSGGANPADPYMTLLGYFSNLKELGVTRSILEDELGAQLADFARNRAITGVPSLFASRSRPVAPAELTSRVNTAEISRTKDRLSRPYAASDHLDVALATNMISVGLDISRLGLMVVLNQPKTAAEYIQATSRVGRQLNADPTRNKPGLVLVLLNPKRPRDRSHFELFPYWHQTFYRHVEATSCTPFASRALDRGLPAVVVALARHLHPALTPPTGAIAADALQQVGETIVEVLNQRCVDAGAADDALGEHRAQRVADQARSLLQEWWGLTQQEEARFQYWSHEKKGAGGGLLHTPLDEDDRARAAGFKHFRANWSLRDVEPAVPIRLVNFGQTFDEEED